VSPLSVSPHFDGGIFLTDTTPHYSYSKHNTLVFILDQYTNTMIYPIRN
jgi:hypothetical protein